MNIGSLVFGKAAQLDLVVKLISILIYLALIVALILWRRANRIVIDKDSRTMGFRKFLSQEPCSLSFNELSGFVTTIQRNKAGKAKVIYLMKNGRRVRKLSGFSYANMDELEQAIGELIPRIMIT
jgi:hypothetical protein